MSGLEKKYIDVAAALIWDGDRFMICQRPPHKTRGLLWEFPGGKLEAGESGEEALVRECTEELGVTVRPLSLFTEVYHDYPDMSVHLLLYNSVIASGVPALLEHCDIRYIRPEEIASYDFCPADKDILKLIKDNVK